MGHSSTKKPRFPLWVHQGKQLWCKKVGKTFYYFGSVADDPSGDRALLQWLSDKDRILSGDSSSTLPDSDALTLVELVDRYLKSKRRLVDSGKRVERTWQDAKSTCDRLVAFFGDDKIVRRLTAEDFERLYADAAKRSGPRTLDGLVTRVRAIFNWASEAELIDWKVRYGEFRLSERRVLLKDAEERGERVFAREDILKLINAADEQMAAMLYLGINAAFGPADLGGLQLSKWNGNEWLNTLRSKTGAARRCWLWPETREAVEKWLAVRRSDLPADATDLLFVTRDGKPWIRSTSYGPISAAFTRLAKRCNVTHRGIYGLRHTHRTISDEAKDQPASMYVMGHLPPSRDMSGTYRKPKNISDTRIKAVCETVRNWLLGSDHDVKESRHGQ